ACFRMVVALGGRADWEALAGVFSPNPPPRADLEAIVHPEVRRLLAEACAPLADTDAVVVFAAPLLVETGSAAGFDLLVVVTAPQAERLARLAARRGMPEAEARARMAAQASDEARLAAADLVVDNGGSEADLEARVAGLWTELRRRARP
ncbi:MAG: dephospho-CoA kinase, partial [Actinomycetota bacterium]